MTGNCHPLIKKYALANVDGKHKLQQCSSGHKSSIHADKNALEESLAYCIFPVVYRVSTWWYLSCAYLLLECYLITLVDIDSTYIFGHCSA